METTEVTEGAPAGEEAVSGGGTETQEGEEKKKEVEEAKKDDKPAAPLTVTLRARTDVQQMHRKNERERCTLPSQSQRAHGGSPTLASAKGAVGIDKIKEQLGATSATTSDRELELRRLEFDIAKENSRLADLRVKIGEANFRFVDALRGMMALDKDLARQVLARIPMLT